VVDESNRRKLWEQGLVIMTYMEDINGSVDRIAGVMNEAGTVFGMMPHPERAVDPLRGWPDGIRLLQSWVESWRERHVYTG
jgi:phosphoribosylformylglycinamidine synthase